MKLLSFSADQQSAFVNKWGMFVLHEPDASGYETAV